MDQRAGGPDHMKTLLRNKNNTKEIINERRENMQNTAGPESNVILFSSAKGGSGCSFIASTVSTYLARKTSVNILLLDLNVGKRDSRIIFGKQPGYFGTETVGN